MYAIDIYIYINKKNENKIKFSIQLNDILLMGIRTKYNEFNDYSGT